MNGVLVFDLSNDLIYKHINGAFKDKVHELALAQGLIAEDASTDASANPDVMMQLFSPLIASQRIMLCQFDNSYQSITCSNFRIVFEEFLGFLFVQFSGDALESIQHKLGVTISFVKSICGPDVYILKKDNRRRLLLSKLIDGWCKLYDNDQAIMVEAVEQLQVTPDIKKVSLGAMQVAADKLKQEHGLQRCHSLIFVGSKLLALYSTKSAQMLASADIFFLNVFCQCLQLPERKSETHLLFLQGCASNSQSGCIPYSASVVAQENGMFCLFLVEYGHLALANGLYDTFFALHKVNNVQMQSDLENLRPAYESLDASTKQTLDALKKIKFGGNEVEEAVRTFQSKWEVLKRKYLDFFKTWDREVVVKIESNMPNFVDAVKELFRLTCMDEASPERPTVTELALLIEEKMTEYTEFLKMKSMKNYSMGSYLEEFPGLVHFLHIDRSAGRVIAPNIDLSVESTTRILKNKVWAMVEMSRNFLQRGHMAMMWKDVAFNYSYFLWFEDLNGTSLKPKELPNYASTNVKPTLHAGIQAGEYYQRLIEICFPKTAPNKIKCYELFCVHLGLVTASCVLEHCRRLAATINDVTGPSGNPIDLL